MGVQVRNQNFPSSKFRVAVFCLNIFIQFSFSAVKPRNTPKRCQRYDKKRFNGMVVMTHY